MPTADAPSRASRAPPSGTMAIASAARETARPRTALPTSPAPPLPLLPIIDGVTAARSGGRARAVPPQPSPAA